MAKLARTVGLLLLAVMPGWGQASLTVPHVTVSLVTENTSLQPGKPAWIGIRFQLEKDWHVYWTNPGDSGEPPKVDWQLPAGFKAGALQFPFPHRLPLQTLMNFGYEDDALYLTQVTVPAGAQGAARLAANIRWMICENTCIPGKATLSISLPVAAAAPKPSPQARLLKDARGRLPQAATWRGSVSAAGDALLFKVKTPAKAAEFFPLDDLLIENAAPQRFSGTAGGFELAVKKSEQLATLPARIKGIIVVDGKRAYKVDLPVRSGGAARTK